MHFRTRIFRSVSNRYVLHKTFCHLVGRILLLLFFQTLYIVLIHISLIFRISFFSYVYWIYNSSICSYKIFWFTNSQKFSNRSQNTLTTSILIQLFKNLLVSQIGVLENGGLKILYITVINLYRYVMKSSQSGKPLN